MTEPQAPAGPDPEPPLDRTISPIAGRLMPPGRGRAIAFAGLLAGCGAVALATWTAERPKAPAPRQTPARQVVDFEPAKAPPPTLARPGHAAPRLDGGIVPALDPSAAADAAPAMAPAAAQGRPSPPAAARPSPLMAYSQAGRAATAGAAPSDPPRLESERGAPSELEALRRHSPIARAQATTLGDRNFLILAGATIPCILQTAVDTTTAGQVTCLVGRDVYSDNGAVVLLEKGTRVLGEYSGGLRQGQARVFVIWSRAVTPAGVAITLASPASDALGRAGFGGAIDTHFGDRFGAAVLLSVIDAGAGALAGRSDAPGSLRLPSDAAGLAVRQGGDIGTTLRKAQGGEVAIQVAQDLDFSSVYALRPRP